MIRYFCRPRRDSNPVYRNRPSVKTLGYYQSGGRVTPPALARCSVPLRKPFADNHDIRLLVVDRW